MMLSAATTVEDAAFEGFRFRRPQAKPWPRRVSWPWAQERNSLSVYLIIESEIVDPSGMAAYRSDADALIVKYGGRVLAVDADPTTVQGDWRPKSIVLVQFPDAQTIQSLFSDPIYQPLKAQRDASSVQKTIVVKGLV